MGFFFECFTKDTLYLFPLWVHSLGIDLPLFWWWYFITRSVIFIGNIWVNNVLHSVSMFACDLLSTDSTGQASTTEVHIATPISNVHRYIYFHTTRPLTLDFVTCEPTITVSTYTNITLHKKCWLSSGVIATRKNTKTTYVWNTNRWLNGFINWRFVFLVLTHRNVSISIQTRKYLGSDFLCVCEYCRV